MTSDSPVNILVDTTSQMPSNKNALDNTVILDVIRPQNNYPQKYNIIILQNCSLNRSRAPDILVIVALQSHFTIRRILKLENSLTSVFIMSVFF